MELEKLAVVAIVGLLSGVLSGIGGGGGGLLMTPLFIFIGLTPQQAIGTSKMNGLGATFGGLSVFHKSGHIRWDIVKVMAPIAILIGISLPFIFNRIDSGVFQRIIGYVMLALIPVLFLKRKLPSGSGKEHRLLGYVMYSVVLFMVALFSGGIGMLANFVLTLLLGTSKLEANATKRAVTATIVPITFVSLLFAGYVVLSIGIIGMVAMFIGTHYGSKLAVNKGEHFATIGMAVLAGVSALALIFSA